MIIGLIGNRTSCRPIPSVIIFVISKLDSITCMDLMTIYCLPFFICNAFKEHAE